MSKIKLLVTFLLVNFMLHAQDDRFQWLEEIDGKEALEFVKKQNQITVNKLSQEKPYQSIFEQSLAIYNSPENIAYPQILGKYVYNFWKDKSHERGIWRRCLLVNYSAKKYEWEVMLDIDALSKADNKKWAFKGASGLFPAYNKFLIKLSNGGGDAVITKEFDTEKKEFIENGFFIDEAKTSAKYLDENTLIIGTDFGDSSLTTSGYPRQTKLWKRGTLLKDAPLLYEGKSTDVGIWGSILKDENKHYVLINRAITFFTSQNFIWFKNKLVTLDIPADCAVTGILKNKLVILLKSDWRINNKTFKGGSLISLNFDSLLKGVNIVHLIIEPDKFSSTSESIGFTKNHLLVNVLTNVTSQLYSYFFENDVWLKRKVGAPRLGSITIISTDEFTDQYFFNFANFITPTTLFYANAKTNFIKPVKSLSAYFDSNKFEVKQFKTKSKDGTLIPYFLVSAKNLKYDGTNPTLLDAYGGFEVSIEPFYMSSYGTAWLNNGGVYVSANIRGGGRIWPQMAFGWNKRKTPKRL